MVQVPRNPAARQVVSLRSQVKDIDEQMRQLRLTRDGSIEMIGSLLAVAEFDELSDVEDDVVDETIPEDPPRDETSLELPIEGES